MPWALPAICPRWQNPARNSIHFSCLQLSCGRPRGLGRASRGPPMHLYIWNSAACEGIFATQRNAVAGESFHPGVGNRRRRNMPGNAQANGPQQQLTLESGHGVAHRRGHALRPGCCNSLRLPDRGATVSDGCRRLFYCLQDHGAGRDRSETWQYPCAAPPR